MVTDSATTGCGLDWFWRHPISQQSEGIMESWKAGVGIGARLVSSERYGEAIRGGGGGTGAFWGGGEELSRVAWWCGRRVAVVERYWYSIVL
jgi:hypothetical protein